MTTRKKSDDKEELMKYCPHCGHKISTSTKPCPACDKSIGSTSYVIIMLATYLLSMLAILAVGLFVIVIAAGFLLEIFSFFGGSIV